MKKILFLLGLVFSTFSFAQTKLGLKLAPVVSSNRVTNDTQAYENDGSSMKLSVGLVLDKPLSDTYYFSSGLIYMPKRAAFRNEDATIIEEYKLQYVQIPLSLKLFTNEVSPDMKLFFQVGGGLEVKVFDEPEEPDFSSIEQFNPVDLAVLLGSGLEFRAGINTTIFGGISYQRGLSNIVNETTAGFVEGEDKLQIRNTIVSIDLGVKF